MVTQRLYYKIKNDFKNDKIECRYYNRFYSIYTYARLFGLGVHQELFISRSLVLERINYLYRQLNPKIFSLNHVFLTNTILFFKINLYKDLAETCFSHIATGNYKNPAPYYSSNLIFDKHPDKAEPVNVFGSASLNTSLYIEFLHLYLQRLKT
jgi:hypothetical protein